MARGLESAFRKEGGGWGQSDLDPRVVMIPSGCFSEPTEIVVLKFWPFQHLFILLIIIIWIFVIKGVFYLNIRESLIKIKIFKTYQ